MIEFVPYLPEHLALVELQPEQAQHRERILRQGYARSLAAYPAFTGLVDGLPVGCAGVVEQWEGCARTWAILGANIPRMAWPLIVRKMRAVLAASDHRRIEADVAWGFGNGCRLASILGFEVEGVRRKYGPDGSDYFLYARVA